MQDLIDLVKEMNTKFCNGNHEDDVSGKDPSFSRIINPSNKGGKTRYEPDMHQINKKCDNIKRFADTIIEELRGRRIPKSWIISNICEEPRIGIQGQKGYGCKPVVNFQKNLRKLVSQLTHIVQDFGIFWDETSLGTQKKYARKDGKRWLDGTSIKPRFSGEKVVLNFQAMKYL